MPTFTELWNAHPGRAFVCDETVFENQCAMRMGHALRACGVQLPADMRTCVGYNARRFKDHAPGHIRSAQQLADRLRANPGLLAAGVTCTVMNGTINDNADAIRGSNGVVFIHNGWDSTDHIDVLNGTTWELKGAFDSADYRQRGQHTWFWNMSGGTS